MEVFKKITNIISNITETVAAFIVGSVGIVLFVQVVMRHLFSTGFSWAEAYSKYATIWMVLLAANILIKDDELIKVDFIDDLLPKKFKEIREIIYQIIFFVLFYILVVEGYKHAISGFSSSIPGFRLKWFWVYLSIPVGSLFMLIQYIYRTLTGIIQKGSD